MAAIPTPDAAPDIALPSDDEKLRRILAIPTGAADVRPQALSNHAIPVTPQTGGKPIPVNRATGQPEELNNAGKPIIPGVAGLWTRAENIHNPILRTLGKIGAVGARAIDVAGSVAAPGIATQVPGSTLNQKVAENRAERQQTGDTENQEREAVTEHTKAETAGLPAKENLEQAQAGALNDKTPKPEDLQQQYADAVHKVVAAGGDPATDPAVRKFADAITGIQKQPGGKPTPAHLTYDQGIPVSATDSKGNVFDVNDPKLPAELKPIVEAAKRAHSQRIGEESSKQAAQFAQQEKMFEARQDALSNTTKTMVEAAPKVLALADRVNKLIDQQAQQLGPAAGRWAEFMAGKVGSPNPEFTKLRTDVGLLQTLLMRMHVGARGGEYIMKHFQDLIDTGKQSPENLKAALGEIVTYAHDVQAEKGGGASGNKSPSSDPLGILR